MSLGIGAGQAEMPIAIILWARPSLFNQERQVVYPIVFTNAARIDEMRAIVFGICEHEIRVRDAITSAGSAGFLCQGSSG